MQRTKQSDEIHIVRQVVRGDSQLSRAGKNFRCARQRPAGAGGLSGCRAMHRRKLGNNLLFVLCERFGQFRELRLQVRVFGLRSLLLRPIYRETELTSAVIKFTGARRRRLVIVEQFAGGSGQRFRQEFGFRITHLDTDILQRNCKRKEFTGRFPTQVVFSNQLLHILGGEPTGAGCRYPNL